MQILIPVQPSWWIGRFRRNRRVWRDRHKQYTHLRQHERLSCQIFMLLFSFQLFSKWNHAKVDFYVAYSCLIMLNHGAKLNFASKTKRNQKRKYYLCNVYPIPEAPMGGGWADIYTYKGVTVRFGFDSVRIWQFEQKLSKTKQWERLMRCIIYSPHWLRTFLSFVVKSAFYILTLAWGFRRCISVVHSKMIFLICYLLDYQ